MTAANPRAGSLDKLDLPKIYFSHGKESGPWGRKIQALASVANKLGFVYESVDYQGLDAEARVDKLCEKLAAQDEQLSTLLVGSSLGAYVSVASSQRVPVKGMFLLAPAVYMPAYPATHILPNAQWVELVHGWDDDIIHPESAFEFALQSRGHLHMLPSDHRLLDVLDELEHLFFHFLQRFTGSQ